MARQRTKTERMARENLFRLMWAGNEDSFVAAAIREQVPDAWHSLEADLDVDEPKEKVTLYLDRSVARFYRAMGHGYQARINRLLATWAQMKIAEALKLADAIEAEARLGRRLWDEEGV